MGEPLLYRISRSAVRAALGFYFREIKVVGGRHVPPSGPVIFAANHPQSITDTLVLGLGVGRMLHYIAHSGLFSNRLKASFLLKSGAIPVYRPRDNADASERNREMFSACRKVLAGGGAIGIFPEGTSQESVGVQPFKTGTARIALESEAEHGFALGVHVVPVGISFESRRRFRTRVLLRFGRPIDAREFRETYEKEPYGAVHELTASLERAIRDLVLDLEHTELARFVEDLEKFCRDDLLEDPRLQLSGESAFERAHALGREIATAVDYYYVRDPDLVYGLRTLLDRYRRLLGKLKVSDREIRRERARTLPGEMVRLALVGVLGLPVALYGALFNIIPYKLTGWAAERSVPDETKIHFFQLVYGTLIYVLYYPALFMLMRPDLGWRGASFFLASLLPTGLFARWYARQLTVRRGAIRFAWLSATQGWAVQRLRRYRRELAREVDRTVEDYLQRQAADQGAGS